MSELIDTARLSIAYHIDMIFSEGELNRDTSVGIFDRSSENASRALMHMLEILAKFRSEGIVD